MSLHFIDSVQLQHAFYIDNVLFIYLNPKSMVVEADQHQNIEYWGGQFGHT